MDIADIETHLKPFDKAISAAMKTKAKHAAALAQVDLEISELQTEERRINAISLKAIASGSKDAETDTKKLLDKIASDLYTLADKRAVITKSIATADYAATQAAQERARARGEMFLHALPSQYEAFRQGIHALHAHAVSIASLETKARQHQPDYKMVNFANRGWIPDAKTANYEQIAQALSKLVAVSNT